MTRPRTLDLVADLQRALHALDVLPDTSSPIVSGPFAPALDGPDGPYIRAQVGPVTATWHGGGYADIRIGSGDPVEVLNMDGDHDLARRPLDECRADLADALAAFVRGDRDEGTAAEHAELLQEYARQGFPPAVVRYMARPVQWDDDTLREGYRRPSPFDEIMRGATGSEVSA